MGRENFEGDELRGQISMSNEERLFSSAFLVDANGSLFI